MKDFYEILEISRYASTEEIKNAYRRLALKYHPDKNNGDGHAESKFKEIVVAYEVLSNPQEKAKYDSQHSQNNEKRGSDDKFKNHSELSSPELILKFATALKMQVKSTIRTKINQRVLFDSIDAILSEKNINVLLRSSDKKTNKEIVLVILECCKPLGNDLHPIQNFVYFEKISSKLIQIVEADKEIVQRIESFNGRNKLSNIWDSYKGIIIISGVIILLFLSTNMFRSNKGTEKVAQRENGEINSSFNLDEQGQKLSAEEIFEQQKDSLAQNGWKKETINNGQLPACYNFTPQKSKINNYLEIVVGGGTDVAIKLMNKETEKCVRYVFINSGTTYKIKNIPEGQYYLKIAYGKNWLSKIIEGQCVGKFIRNPIYEKGDEILDYNLKYDDGGYSIPNFRLSLDVLSTGVSSSFNSEKISEGDFNL